MKYYINFCKGDSAEKSLIFNTKQDAINHIDKNGLLKVYNEWLSYGWTSNYKPVATDINVPIKYLEIIPLQCTHLNTGGKLSCDDLYNCCDCGDNRGDGCGCGYCWSCNACENCLNEE